MVYCLWSERFDCKMTDIFAVQEEMAKSIPADLLRVELGSEAGTGLVKRYTDNFEAYDQYLRGRFQWNKRGGEGFEEKHWNTSSARPHPPDPNYAPRVFRHCRLSRCDGVVGTGRDPTEAWPKGQGSGGKSAGCR